MTDHSPEIGEEDEDFSLPVEIELYIQPDGSVVFADLADDVLPIARELNPSSGDEPEADTPRDDDE